MYNGGDDHDDDDDGDNDDDDDDGGVIMMMRIMTIKIIKIFCKSVLVSSSQKVLRNNTGKQSVSFMAIDF